jgi:hypothetical protein
VNAQGNIAAKVAYRTVKIDGLDMRGQRLLVNNQSREYPGRNRRAFDRYRAGKMGRLEAVHVSA